MKKSQDSSAKKKVKLNLSIGERYVLEKTARQKGMTLRQFLFFALTGVSTPEKKDVDLSAVETDADFVCFGV